MLAEGNFMKTFTFPKGSLRSIQPQILLLEHSSLIHKVIPLNPKDLLPLNFHRLIHFPRNYLLGIHPALGTLCT